MPDTAIQQSDYTALRARVETLLAAGRTRAQQAVERERVQTYWQVGGEVDAFLQAHGAGYGEQVLRRLSRDLDLRERLLYETVEFRRSFQKLPPGAILTWSHYRRLISIRDADVRATYLEQTIEHGWSVRQLELQIQDIAQAVSETLMDSDLQAGPLAPLAAKRGDLYVYRVVDRPGTGLALDLGFRTYRSLPDAGGLTVGDLVQGVPDRRMNDGYRFEPAERQRRIYAYPAAVSSFIDGDTLWVSVDCGFRMRAEQKVRLRGIDTPELGTAGGQRSAEYVKEVLSAAGAFVISTTKVDRFDRYLTDIFYLPGEEDLAVVVKEGRFLNRELIDAELARRWTGEAPPEW